MELPEWEVKTIARGTLEGNNSKLVHHLDQRSLGLVKIAMESEMGKSLMTKEETEKEIERSLANVPMRDLRTVTSEKTGITEIVIGLGIEIGIGIEREIVAMNVIEHVIEDGIEVVTMSVTEIVIAIVIGIEIGRGIGIGIMKGDIQTLIVVAPMIGTIMIGLNQNMKRIDMVIGTGILIVLKLRMVVGGMISLTMGTDTQTLIMIPSTMITLNIAEVEGNMITQKAIMTKIVMISMMIEWRMITIMSVALLNHMIERGLVI